MPCGLDVLGACVRRDVTGRVDHRDLAHLGCRVAREQRLQRVVGALPRAHQLEPELAVARIHERLRRDHADAASAQGTTEPTLNQCDCTATPNCPVAGSRATIENVWTGLSG
jgi:hypothetical protein